MKLMRNERGFTLIELMVVVIIIGILAAITIPTMGKQIDKTKVMRAVAELKSMKTQIDIYYAENGTVPEASNNADSSSAISRVLRDAGFDWKDTNDAANTGLEDPWGNAYIYSVDDTTDLTAYKVSSGGPNGGIAAADIDKNDDIVITLTENPTEECGFDTTLDSTALSEANVSSK